MRFRLPSIIGWTSALLVAALNIFAGIMKFMPVEPGSQAEQFNQALGMVGLEKPLGVLELTITALFLIPRTSTVGLVLMTGYMGGVLATMLTHGISHSDAGMIYLALALLAVSGWFRNPELITRLRTGKA